MKNDEKIMEILKNHVRLWTFTIVMNSENKNFTISDVHKGLCSELKKQYDYKNTHKHIKFLEKIGVIKLHKQKTKKQGQPVCIEFIAPELREMFLKFMKILKPEIIMKELEEHK